MKTLIFDYEKPYIPKTKVELVDVLAEHYSRSESQKKNYPGKKEEEIKNILSKQYSRMKKSRLYAIYFNTFPGHKPKNKSKKFIDEVDVQTLISNLNITLDCLVESLTDAENETDLGLSRKSQDYIDYIEANLPRLKKLHEVYYHKISLEYEEIKNKFSL